jgi:hypothetical protein
VIKDLINRQLTVPDPGACSIHIQEHGFQQGGWLKPGLLAGEKALEQQSSGHRCMRNPSHEREIEFGLHVATGAAVQPLE